MHSPLQRLGRRQPTDPLLYWSQMTFESTTKTPSELVGLTGFEPATI